MIERRVIDQIIDRAEIADVVGDFITLHKKGRDFVGLCPFHDDSRPSFNVSVSKNICKCFVCGEGGTPLSFLMKHENLSFPEAIKYLGKKYGIEVIEKESSPEEEARKSEREKLLNANNFARDQFATELQEGAEGRRIGLSYFRERGLTDKTIKEFELGYSPEDWEFLVGAAKKKGIEFETLEYLGLISKSKKGDWYDRYRERIIFPIHSISGNVVGFGGRILKKVENVGKYINSPASDLYDKSNELYGLYFSKQQISRKDKCLVVEGYMDVISMFQSGVKNVVASSGTALTPRQVQLIKRYTSNVTLIFDADNAGLDAAIKGLDVCLQKGMNVKILRLPEGEDPDSFAQSHTLEDIEDYITQNEQDGLHFKADLLTQQLGEEAQAKAQIISDLAESISLIEDAIIRELYTKEMSEVMGITESLLAQKIVRLRETRKGEERQANIREQQRRQKELEEHALNQPQTQPNNITNLSTKFAPHTQQKVASKVKKPKLEAPLNAFEVDLLKFLIFEGSTYLEFSELSDGRIGASVIELIHDQTQDLKQKGILTASFEKLMETLVVEQANNPDLDTRKFITWHDDPNVLFYANQIVTDEEVLSPLHDAFVKEQKKEKELERRIYNVIVSYKNAVIESEIAEVIRAVNECEKNNQAEEGMRLLKRLAELNRQKKIIANILGDRILTPKNKIK